MAKMCARSCKAHEQRETAVLEYLLKPHRNACRISEARIPDGRAYRGERKIHRLCYRQEQGSSGNQNALQVRRKEECGKKAQ